MQIGKTGGLIAAASKKATRPNLKLGSITIVQQIVLTFQQAGVFPIAVVTGVEADEVKYALPGGASFFFIMKNIRTRSCSRRCASGWISSKTRASASCLRPQTCRFFRPRRCGALLAAEGDVVTPSFRRKGGHPIVISNGVIPGFCRIRATRG
jgi:CTP:molybdopterin cytidylyltransferase MocA